MPLRKSQPGSLTWLGKYLSLALTLPASVVAGYFFGSLCASWLEVPFFKVLGLLFGMAAGLIQIFRELNRETKLNK